jgi:hypothetical protein
VEEGKRTRVGNRPSHSFFLCFIFVPDGGKSKLTNRDVHYRRYVAAKLRSDDLNTRIYRKEV